jgi:hypothetical protein
MTVDQPAINNSSAMRERACVHSETHPDLCGRNVLRTQRGLWVFTLPVCSLPFHGNGSWGIGSTGSPPTSCFTVEVIRFVAPTPSFPDGQRGLLRWRLLRGFCPPGNTQIALDFYRSDQISADKTKLAYSNWSLNRCIVDDRLVTNCSMVTGASAASSFPLHPVA